MEAEMKVFNQKIKEGYRVNWKETKQQGRKTIIVMEKLNQKKMEENCL